MKEKQTTKSKKKGIAVLMSTYNGERYLEQQIDSILSQKCEYAIDLHIRDDGSNDNTVEIIKKYQEQYPNIYLYQSGNVGCNASFFELLKKVDGYDYYAFSDQDDIWMDDKLQAAVDYLEKENSNYPLLYGSCSILVDDSLNHHGITQKKNKDITFFNTIIQNFLPGHSQVMNSKLREILMGLKIDYSRMYYYDSWVTNVAMVEGRVVFDNKPHTLYRQHSKNAIGYGEGRLKWFKERVNRIRDRHLKQYSKQIDYFIEMYQKKLNSELMAEMRNYQESKRGFLRRVCYVVRSRLYRQNPIETKMFKMMYLLKMY